MRLANFTITEKLAGWNEQFAGISVTLAIQNKAPADLYFASDFLLLDAAGEPIAALNADPPKSRVEKGKGAIANGATAVAPGSLGRAKQICMRWFAIQLPEGK
ncbi:hypothetical protein EHI47_14260 [Rhizobium leguminosarum]|uniref:Uncharacterized protein n=1 Tax=Rhizobium leguminosarum TaxID=384 RepID=A0A444I0S0_RHILE|nr:hypothetical protein [Rhizobium leguminosarum]RWX30614.1 hypothetical protein EHI47_14260 [Rhizobium leguminosarum]